MIRGTDEQLDIAQAPMASHLRQKRLQIMLTYMLSFLENGFDLLYPFLIGLAINGLLASDATALVPLITVWLTHIVVSGGRQIYDTRLFAKLSADIGTALSVVLKERGRDDGEISAQVDMAGEYVDFFETEIPALVTILVSLFGSIAMLVYYDWVSGALIGALLVPVGIINWWLARKSVLLNRSINDQQERQVETISLGMLRGLRRHFGRIARWKIGLSNADAFSWIAAEILTLCAFIIVLYRLAGLSGATVGTIFAGIAYLLRILDDLDMIPDAVQQLGRLIDIRRRIDQPEIVDIS